MDLMLHEPDPHRDRLTELEQRIDQLCRLRGASGQGSANEMKYQAEIDQLLNEHQALESQLPRIAELDWRVAETQRELTRARGRSRHAADGWMNTAKGAAGVGLVLLIAGLWWGWVPAAVPWVGALLLAGAVGAIFPGIRARRATDGEVDRLQTALGRLRAERDHLITGRALVDFADDDAPGDDAD